MAKGLGKIILTSSVLAGAALGAYTFFKKEGLIDENKTPAENAVNIRNKVTADAAEYFNRDRSYVDLNDEGTEKMADVSPDNIVKHAADGISAVTEKVKDGAKSLKNTVTESIGKAIENTEEALEKAEDAVEDVAEDVADAVEDVKEEAEEEFKAGIVADKIEAADSKPVGSTVSEEFFNDEA